MPLVAPKNGPSPQLLLLLTPPFSGSTAIAAFLAQLQGAIGLARRYEGQWLVPALSASNRWQSGIDVDWADVARKWGAVIDAAPADAMPIRYVIETSPPNMVRYQGVISLFERISVVVNNRNPFANVASVAYRMTPDLDDKTSEDRKEIIDGIVKSWIKRSALLKDIAQTETFPLLGYENFCADPLQVFETFGVQGPQAVEDYAVSVKDYPAQPIRNMNAEQIARLTAQDIGQIQDALSGHGDLLGFFGYSARLSPVS